MIRKPGVRAGFSGQLGKSMRIFRSWARGKIRRENLVRLFDPCLDVRTEEEYGRGVATVLMEHARVSLVLGLPKEPS